MRNIEHMDLWQKLWWIGFGASRIDFGETGIDGIEIEKLNWWMLLLAGSIVVKMEFMKLQN